jgi:tetratricopeptide (TPR) repeat protein
MALEKKPDYAKAHFNLGNVLEQQGRRGEAIAHFREALRLKSDYSQARIRLEAASAVERVR